MNSLEKGYDNSGFSSSWNVHPEAFKVRTPEKERLAEVIMSDIYKNIRSGHRKDLYNEENDKKKND
jgi:hypothetical protein